MNDVLAWYAEWSPTLTACLGGGAAMLAAVLLFLVAVALGPDLPVLQCIGPRARGYIHLTAFSWFVRGVLVLTSLPLPGHGLAEVTCSPAGERHPHWDMVWSWGQTVGLLGYALAYLWKQRMPPEIRARFDRREAFKREVVKGFVAEGRNHEAELVAEGTSLGMQQAYELGLSPATARQLHDAP